MSFSYQELDVYYIALGFVDSLHACISNCPDPLNPLIEQLDRSAVEIPLSIARLSGEYGDLIPPQEILKVRGIVYMVQSLLEICWQRKMISEKDSEEFGNTLIVLARMLAEMSTQSRETSRMQRPQPRPFT